MKTIDERINALEELFYSPSTSGASLSRVLTQHDGLQWCLSLGSMYVPKMFFTATTIEDCIDMAESSEEIHMLREGMKQYETKI